MPKEGEVRLTPAQAGKVWDRAFATTWHEIFEGHPSRSALERFVRAGHGGEEVARFIETGELDVTIGMPTGARYQQAPEGVDQTSPHPDATQADRMAQIAFATGQPVAGSL